MNNHKAGHPWRKTQDKTRRAKVELYARANKALTKVTLEKTGEHGLELITLKEAKRIWNDGDATDYNLTFERLVGYDFSTDALLEFYREVRDIEQSN